MSHGLSSRSISLVLAATLGCAATSAEAKPCEIHVWAADTGRPLAPDPATLSPVARSQLSNVLDAGQRLYEIDPKQLKAEFGLPEDTVVTVHHERSLSRIEAEKSKIPLNNSDTECYIDWIFRADAGVLPSPNKTIIFSENHAQMFFYSLFRAFRSGQPLIRVKGIHRGRLPVLSGTQKDKLWVYDTVDGTRQLISHAAEKVRDNLGPISLVAQ